MLEVLLGEMYSQSSTLYSNTFGWPIASRDIGNVNVFQYKYS
jgi:hypothetical protein